MESTESVFQRTVLVNSVIYGIGLLVAAALCSPLFADPNTSGVITFCDGVQAKVQVVDTSGCTVVFINRNGAKVAVRKNRVRTLEWNSRIVDYSSFQCAGRDTKPLGVLEPAPKEALMATLLNLPVKQQQTLLDSTVYYCRVPLSDLRLEPQFDTAAAAFLHLLRGLKKKEVTPEVASKLLLDSISTNGYLAVCFSVHENDFDVNQYVPSAMPSGSPFSHPAGPFSTLQIKEIRMHVRVILASLKPRFVIFDEEASKMVKDNRSYYNDPDSNTAPANASSMAIKDDFEEIEHYMVRQGLVERQRNRE